MKRKIYNHDSSFFHVIGKSNHKIWPAKSLQTVWATLNNFLNISDKKLQIKTHAFVMMSNHYHWLCSSLDSQSNLEKNLLWFDTIKVIPLNHIEAYRQAYFYIYNNPVKAKIVTHAEHYPFSTLPYLLGRTPNTLSFTCWDQMNLLSDPKRVLARLSEEARKGLDTYDEVNLDLR